jgi:hypothetical protein
MVKNSQIHVVWDTLEPKTFILFCITRSVFNMHRSLDVICQLMTVWYYYKVPRQIFSFNIRLLTCVRQPKINLQPKWTIKLYHSNFLMVFLQRFEVLKDPSNLSCELLGRGSFGVAIKCSVSKDFVFVMKKVSR